MTRDWHGEYDKAAQEYHEARANFKEADSARAVALATMNMAERELNRLFALRFNTPGVTVTSPDRPAYADPNFKYNETTGSYHRITAPQTSTIRPGPMEGAGLNPASDRKDQSLVEEGGSTPPLAATHTRPVRGGTA